ncbi:formamidase [Variibacter gotjawalensis]|uniref:Formamidase n=1 Tax=Variibacter gotjawalensis TaxID=1333996 RepID=A0A0S3PYF7_9BRAD|nr:acetamidase/formamidase family protein [Variibacter gotjawalensis]NIK46818.1 acetamidase/formamidase [Variibacter gotjawalensis]RZS48722.1 acetamidase/formamidase [Variibacter gotjawalensis]BAT60981.1 formamidase [Variibacter gotjawalensis]
MTHHKLPATAKTVTYGVLDAALPPVLEIESGDKVTVETISGGPWQLPPDGKGLRVLPEYAEIHAAHKFTIGPHILTGPIAVKGAERGDVIELRILDVKLRTNWGYNVIRPLSGTLPEDFGEFYRLMHIELSLDENVALLPWGKKLPLSPFFGVMGTAPTPAYGAITSMIPREFGGNLDNKQLLPGSTLYLPCFNDGGKIFIGDGHAVQGDGEVCVTAIETAMEGTFEIILRKDLKIKLPRAETPTHYMTMAFNIDLDLAAQQALRDMIAWASEISGLAREDAYTLCSLACDMHITQLVNGNKGVHAMLPKSQLDGLKK